MTETRILSVLCSKPRLIMPWNIAFERFSYSHRVDLSYASQTTLTMWLTCGDKVPWYLTSQCPLPSQHSPPLNWEKKLFLRGKSSHSVDILSWWLFCWMWEMHRKEVSSDRIASSWYVLFAVSVFSFSFHSILSGVSGSFLWLIYVLCIFIFPLVLRSWDLLTAMHHCLLLFAFLPLYMLATAGRNARLNQPFYHCVPLKSQRSFLKCFWGNNYVKSGS